MISSNNVVSRASLVFKSTAEARLSSTSGYATLPPLSPDGRRWTVSGHPVFVGDGRGDAFLEPGTSRNRQLDNTIRKHSTIGFIYPSSLLLRPAINQVPCPELFEVETAGSSHGLSGITRTSRSTGQPEGTIYPVRELRISG